jgi:hypothetical protein
MGKPAHVAHILCGQPHLTLNAFCIDQLSGLFFRQYLAANI